MDIDELLAVVYESLEHTAKKTGEKISGSKPFSRYSRAEDPFEKVLEDVSSVLTKGYDALSEKAKPVINRSGEKMREAVYAKYRAAGMPYGDNPEGFRLWLKDQETQIRTRSAETCRRAGSAAKKGAAAGARFAAREASDIRARVEERRKMREEQTRREKEEKE